MRRHLAIAMAIDRLTAAIDRLALALGQQCPSCSAEWPDLDPADIADEAQLWGER